MRDNMDSGESNSSILDLILFKRMIPIVCDRLIIFKQLSSQEIVWQITQGFQPEKSKKINPEARSPYLEVSALLGTPSSEEEERAMKEMPPFMTDTMNYAKGMEDPRVIKTHLPVDMLNPDIFKKAKGK